MYLWWEYQLGTWKSILDGKLLTSHWWEEWLPWPAQLHGPPRPWICRTWWCIPSFPFWTPSRHLGSCFSPRRSWKTAVEIEQLGSKTWTNTELVTVSMTSNLGIFPCAMLSLVKKHQVPLHPSQVWYTTIYLMGPWRLSACQYSPTWVPLKIEFSPSSGFL